MGAHFKILVATDYSKAGINAEKYAIQLAKATNSSLLFFHVFDVPFYPPKRYSELEEIFNNVNIESENLKEHIERMLQSLKIKPGDIDYKCIVRQGPLAGEIFSEAEVYDIDFIIMGTHESGIMQTILMGNHTWEVIRDAAIPVLAIPDDVSFKSIKHIVFATEYRKGEIPAIKFLISLAKNFDAKLTILHVYNNVFSPEFEKEIFERFKNEVTDMFSYNKLSIHLIHNDNLVEGLNNFCIHSKANWLVMSHERVFFLIDLINPASVTKKMSTYTQVPLLAVPDKYNPKSRLELKLEENGHAAGMK